MAELNQTGGKLCQGVLFGVYGFWYLALVSGGKQHLQAGLKNWAMELVWRLLESLR